MTDNFLSRIQLNSKLSVGQGFGNFPFDLYCVLFWQIKRVYKIKPLQVSLGGINKSSSLSSFAIPKACIADEIELTRYLFLCQLVISYGRSERKSMFIRLSIRGIFLTQNGLRSTDTDLTPLRPLR